jgi:hypothetical protein
MSYISKSSLHNVYILEANDISTECTAKIEDIECRIEKSNNLKFSVFYRLLKFYGIVRFIYLFVRYGKSNTYINYIIDESHNIIYSSLIVPSYKLKKKYDFTTIKKYSIIACKTRKKFERKGLYSSQLSIIKNSHISENGYIIWTSIDNVASNRGIIKAGGKRIAELRIHKYFLGLLTKCDNMRMES